MVQPSQRRNAERDVTRVHIYFFFGAHFAVMGAQRDDRLINMTTTNQDVKQVKVIKPLTLSELAIKAEAQSIQHFGLNEECTREDLLNMPIKNFNKLLHFSEEAKSMDKYPGYMRHILLQRIALQQDTITQQNVDILRKLEELMVLKDKCPMLNKVVAVTVDGAAPQPLKTTPLVIVDDVAEEPPAYVELEPIEAKVEAKAEEVIDMLQVD